MSGKITAAKRKSAKSRRKVGGIITAAKRKSVKSRRKAGGKVTAAKRKIAKSHRYNYGSKPQNGKMTRKPTATITGQNGEMEK